MAIVPTAAYPINRVKSDAFRKSLPLSVVCFIQRTLALKLLFKTDLFCKIKNYTDYLTQTA